MKEGSGRCHVFFVSVCVGVRLVRREGKEEGPGRKGGCFLGEEAYVSVRLFLLADSFLAREKGEDGELSYMVVDRPKDLLRRYEQTRHLPYRHLEIHLRELE